MPAESLTKLTKAQLIERVQEVDSQATNLQESFARVVDALRREDRGWQAVFAPADPACGLSLEEIHEFDEKITPAVAANPLIGGAKRLRGALVFQDGIKHRGLPANAQGKG